MNVNQRGRGVRTWTLGTLALVIAALAAPASWPAWWAANVAFQNGDKDKEKKDEKKEEKKDEKKGLPLKPTRKIQFTTDEGTWLSLDVSADGKTIVFDLLGDLYTLPIAGGEAKLIDGGMAFDSQPRFSPDGKWIAFISDREATENVYIMHPTGSDQTQV